MFTSMTAPPSLLPWKRYDNPRSPEVLEPTESVEEAGYSADCTSDTLGTCMIGLDKALRAIGLDRCRHKHIIADHKSCRCLKLLMSMVEHFANSLLSLSNTVYENYRTT